MDVIRCDHLNASIARTIVLITVNEQFLSANTSCEFSAKINNEPATMKIAIEKYTTILGILPHGPITSFATALQDNRDLRSRFMEKLCPYDNVEPSANLLRPF